MDIYTPGGSIDLATAATALRQSGSITGESMRKAVVAEITAAALLDIAASLRPLAEEAEAAMSDEADLARRELAILDVEPEAAEDFVVEGDLVAVNGLDDPAEVIGFGESEGAIYVRIRLVDGTETRAWLTDVTRLRGDENDDDAMQEASESASAAAPELDDRVVESETTEPEPIEHDAEAVAIEIADDIDDDFDGDQHPAAASALDVLKANEAARKAAKKSGSKSGAKKGKKS